MYTVGMYIRLSKEDEYKNNNKESESVINQRSLILSYIEDNNLKLYSEYVDDGYSGTTFDRPGFNKMIKDIEDGKINMVVTKDLSRLGRDYIQSGYYIEQYFPLKKVRYVSILDNIDTSIDSTNNDIAPFKSLFNDIQSKDSSKKIRSILRVRKKQGLFLGSSPAFGYKRSEDNKYKLVIDENVSFIVRKIFDLALDNKSNTQIANILNQEKFITPIVYKNNKISKRFKNPEKWSSSSVRQILSNKMYTGNMVQCVQAKLNYKSMKRIRLDKNQWIEVKNTHQAIVSEEEFELINNRHRNRQQLKTKRKKQLLVGLIYCEECGCLLGMRVDKRNENNIHYTLNCNGYSRNHCVSHFMIYDSFEKEILRLLRCHLNRVKLSEIEKFMLTTYQQKDELFRKKQFFKNQKNYLENKIKNIYDDKIKGIIDEDVFIILLNSTLKDLKNTNYEIEKNDKNKVDFNVKELIKLSIDRDLIIHLIEKITVSKDKKVNIYYKFS